MTETESVSGAALAALIAALPTNPVAANGSAHPAPTAGPAAPIAPPSPTLQCRECGKPYEWQPFGEGATPGNCCSTTCFDLSLLRLGMASDSMKRRPKLYVENISAAAEWLRVSIGTGPLAGMFARGEAIVHTPREGENGYVPLTDDQGDDDGPAQVRPIKPGGVAARVDFTHYVVKRIKKGDDYIDVEAQFPTPAAVRAAEVPDLAPNLRPLRGVIHTPVLRRDGTLVEAPGYDPATKLLHLPEPGLTVPPVPDRPSHEQVAAAVALLDTMTAGFRWLSDHDRANYYGLLLTPLLRALVPPPYKLGVIGAPMRGSGKSLLAEVARILHGGVFRVEMPEDEAELRKQVTSILSVTTGPVVQFDNVSGVLRSSTLAGLLTSNVWEDRPLGSTDMVKTTNDRQWIITGNNVNLGGDLIRRALWVTIDPGVPNPHLRTDFAIKDLPGWTRGLRGPLLGALLTLVRAWVVADRPTRPRGGDSYARWIEAVDGILTHAGVPGTFDHGDAARQQEGADDDEWADFLAAIHRARGDDVWTVKELLGEIGDSLANPGRISLDSLPAELADAASRPGVGVQGIARKLGMWLRNRDGRWAGNLTVRKRGKDRDGRQRWQVEAARGAESAESAECSSVPAQNRPDDIMPLNGQGAERLPAGTDSADSADSAPHHPDSTPSAPPNVTRCCDGSGCGICAPTGAGGW